MHIKFPFTLCYSLWGEQEVALCLKTKTPNISTLIKNLLLLKNAHHHLSSQRINHCKDHNKDSLLTPQRRGVSKCCWKNGIQGVAWPRVATNLHSVQMQYLRSVVKQSTIKWGMPVIWSSRPGRPGVGPGPGRGAGPQVTILSDAWK